MMPALTAEVPPEPLLWLAEQAMAAAEDASVGENFLILAAW
jgi:hypothetical protein